MAIMLYALCPFHAFTSHFHGMNINWNTMNKYRYYASFIAGANFQCKKVFPFGLLTYLSNFKWSGNVSNDGHSFTRFFIENCHLHIVNSQLNIHFIFLFRMAYFIAQLYQAIKI